jgi:hypothetical protein
VGWRNTEDTQAKMRERGMREREREVYMSIEKRLGKIRKSF